MNRVTRSVLTGLLAAALGGSALALPAEAAPRHGGPDYRVRVSARPSLRLHTTPTAISHVTVKLKHGAKREAYCKVRSEPVRGNALWYKVETADGASWGSARYLDNRGKAPRYCGKASGYTGRTTAYVVTNVTPDDTSAGAGPLNRGTTVKIRCKITGPSVGGNRRWYYLTDHRWLSARYVSNVRHAPSYC